MSTWWGKLSLKNKLQIPIQRILQVIMVMAQRMALNTSTEASILSTYNFRCSSLLMMPLSISMFRSLYRGYDRDYPPFPGVIANGKKFTCKR